MGPERAEWEVEQKHVKSRKRRTTGQEQREKDQEKMEQGGLNPRKRKRTQEEGEPKWSRRSQAEIERDQKLIRRYQDPTTVLQIGECEGEEMEKLLKRNKRLERIREQRRNEARERLQNTNYERVPTASPSTGQLHQ